MPLTQGQRDRVESFFVGFGPKLIDVQDAFIDARNLIGLYDRYPPLAGTISDPELRVALGDAQSLGLIREKVRSTLQTAIDYVNSTVTP